MEFAPAEPTRKPPISTCTKEYIQNKHSVSSKKNELTKILPQNVDK
jgi:hypothetical protein